MDHIKYLKTFESFSIKNPLGQKMVYCHDRTHSFDVPTDNSRNLICPSCGNSGFLNREMSYLKPIERKF
jgi:hypothetical protein